ncbi:MAG TPA: hypothetical protein PKD98_14935 [Anaerolineae bacterium]|nr:hypothetical protein [Anaerolineae bacterium]
MTEEQLAQLLDEYLDAFLAGEPLPDDLPPEVAELLAVAGGFSELAPVPRPEFGPALKESLLDSLGDDRGDSAQSDDPDPSGALAGQDDESPASAVDPVSGGLTLSAVVVGLLVIAAGLALLASLAILAVVGVSLWREAAPTVAPASTPIINTPGATSPPARSPEPATPPPSTPTGPALNLPGRPSPTASPPSRQAITPTPAGVIESPAPTATPIVDILPAVTVSVEVRTDPPSLAPGSGGGGGGGNDDSGNGGSGGGGGGGGGGDDDDDDGGEDDDD